MNSKQFNDVLDALFVLYKKQGENSRVEVKYGNCTKYNGADIIVAIQPHDFEDANIENDSEDDLLENGE